jgi:hypothetical protein
MPFETEGAEPPRNCHGRAGSQQPTLPTVHETVQRLREQGAHKAPCMGNVRGGTTAQE